MFPASSASSASLTVSYPSGEQLLAAAVIRQALTDLRDMDCRCHRSRLRTCGFCDLVADVTHGGLDPWIERLCVNDDSDHFIHNEIRRALEARDRGM